MTGIQKLDLSEIVQSLDKISNFLMPCLPVANAHATDFITHTHWDILIPKGVKDELLTLSEEQLRNLPTDVSCLCNGTCDSQDSDRFTDSATQQHLAEDVRNYGVLTKPEECAINCHIDNQLHTTHNNTFTNKYTTDNKKKAAHFPYSCLSDFIKDAKLCSIEGIGIAVPPQDLIHSIGGQGDEIFVGTFMNQKKSHEVEIMSKTCASLAKYLNCRLVVDFGSGKGYLGNHLSLQYGLPVLGIDAAHTNTQSAERRNTILDKQWDSLARNKMFESQGRKLTKKEKRKLKERGKEKVTVDEQTDSIHSKENVRQHNGTDSEKAVETKRQFEAVVKTEHDEHSEACTTSSIKVTNETVNIGKFVPCTTFIDKESNFVNLAKLHFPELFAKLYTENEHEDKRHIKCIQEECDSVEMAELNVNVKEKLSVTQNQSTYSCTDVESSQLTDMDNYKVESFSNKSYDYKSQCAHAKEVWTDTRDRFKIMLTGLHTCGNLASTSMEVFVRSDELKVLCNVGCCYHLLDEKYQDMAPVDEIDISHKGFPLSKFLIQRRFQLGNTARNLASQSLHRISDIDKLQGERFYPRAVLEVLIQDVCGPNGIVMKGMRKLEQKCTSTQEYIRKACDKLGISDKVSDVMIESYTKKYRDDRHRLAAFFQLKTVLAPCIESLIILDRVCYLLEQEQVKDVFLVKMFDPAISPRCYGIVAIK